MEIIPILFPLTPTEIVIYFALMWMIVRGLQIIGQILVCNIILVIIVQEVQHLGIVLVSFV